MLIVGLISFFVGLVFLSAYLLVNRKKGFQIVNDLSGFGSIAFPLGLLLIPLDIFWFKLRFFLFGGIFLSVPGLIFIIMHYVRKSMKTKKSIKEINEIVIFKGKTGSSRDIYYSVCNNCQAVLEYTLAERGFEAQCKRCDFTGRLPNECIL